MPQPVPFEIFDAPAGGKIASNGAVAVVCEEKDAKFSRRRGIRGIGLRTPAEQVIPQLNKLAGDLVARLDMPAGELRARLIALIEIASPPERQNVEFLRVDVGGLNVFVDATTVIISRKDLQI